MELDELPVWARIDTSGVWLPRERDRIRVKYHVVGRDVSDVAIGEYISIRASTPRYCWSCYGAYRSGEIVNPYGARSDTKRHVRRRGCTYRDPRSGNRAVEVTHTYVVERLPATMHEVRAALVGLRDENDELSALVAEQRRVLDWLIRRCRQIGGGLVELADEAGETLTSRTE